MAPLGRVIFAATLLASGPAYGQSVEQQESLAISAHVDAVTDYRFRGVSLSGLKPAVQAGIDLSHRTGWYAGAWASNIAEYSGAEVEVDLYAGHAGTAFGLEYTVGVIGMVYPGGSGTNYYELNGSLAKHVGPVRLKASMGFSPDQRNLPSQNFYTSGEVAVDLPDSPVSVSFSLGRENGLYSDKIGWAVAATYTGERYRLIASRSR